MPTLTLFKRSLLALVAGSVSYFAYPSPNFWPAIFLSVAGIYLALRDLGFWKGAVVGLLGGLAFYVSQIYWISQYLGPEPLIALAGLEAIIFAVGAGVIAMCSKVLSNPWLIAPAVAAVWNGREWLSTHFPYGGFPWSRVAMSQADSPLAFWVSVGGFGLLSFIVVALTVLGIELLHSNRKALVRSFALILLVAFAVPVTLQSTFTVSSQTLRIAGIQGNANAGLFANEERGTILRNHLDATEALLGAGESFDLVVWPENASDVNPEDNPEVADILTTLIDDQLNTPLIFGTITENNGEMFNSSKLWVPGRGEVDQYDKKRPVPFGEYVPDRDFFYALSPDLVGMITRGYSFGTRDGIFEVSGKKLGVLICFEEAIDELPRDLVSAGAKLIIAQTNNADFGRSDESVQQLAIARLRAIETGRAIVNSSTVGPSAIINAKGELLDSTSSYVSDFVIDDVPLSSEINLAMRGGWLFDPISAILAAAIAVGLFVDNRRRTTKL